MTDDLKIAFDQQIFLLQEYGGISRYICNLARELALMASVKTQIFAPLHLNRNLKTLKQVQGAKCFVPKVNTKLFPLTSMISKNVARIAMSHFKPNILHETYYSFDDYCPTGALRVLTVYDFIHERYPDRFQNSQMTIVPKKIAAQRADHIICISNSTRNDLIEYCEISPEKTSVIYLGVDPKFIPERQREAESNEMRRPYLLYVGVRGGYKNFKCFLSAFSTSKRLRSEFDILCFGGGSFTVQELRSASDFGLRQDQLIHRSGEDDLLVELYQNAAALVYPSLYEGFGIPPLEAMALGCPVIISNTSSLPEVVGNAGEYFDPNQEESIRIAIERVVYSPTRCAELISLGLQQYTKFSWHKCALETYDVYRKLL